MSDVIPVPTMSTLGFVSDSANKFDMLLAHAFVADYNQTQLYVGQVTSISRILEKAGTNQAQLLSSVQSAFYDYLSRYYTQVEVTATIVGSAVPGEAGQLTLQLEFIVTESNVPSAYGRLVSTANGKLKSIIKLNNYG